MEGIRNKVLLNPAILSRTTGYSGFVRGSRLYLLNVGGLNMGGSERETGHNQKICTAARTEVARSITGLSTIFPLSGTTPRPSRAAVSAASMTRLAFSTSACVGA